MRNLLLVKGKRTLDDVAEVEVQPVVILAVFGTALFHHNFRAFHRAVDAVNPHGAVIVNDNNEIHAFHVQPLVFVGQWGWNRTSGKDCESLPAPRNPLKRHQKPDTVIDLAHLLAKCLKTPAFSRQAICAR